MNTLNFLLEELSITNSLKEERGFKPIARYYESMDFLLYLNEDCSYRADRVSGFITVLLHPQEDRLVGLKLKGFKFLFNHLKNHSSLRENDFVPLIKVLELAFTMGIGETLVNSLQLDRLEKMYKEAADIIEGIDLPPEEWRKAA
jgi:hypothetical protein